MAESHKLVKHTDGEIAGRKPNAGEEYFHAVVELLGDTRDGKKRALISYSYDPEGGTGFIPILLYKPGENSPAVDITRYVAIFPDGGIGVQDTIKVNGNRRSLEINFELDREEKIINAPEGNGEYFTQMIAELRSCSVTRGAKVYCNNSPILISDGQKWIPYSADVAGQISSGGAGLPSGTQG